MNTSEVEELAQNVKRRFDHEAAKQQLQEKYEAKMLFAAYGGMWRAGPALIAACKSFPDNYLAYNTQAVLTDEYGNPCQVNLGDLYEQSINRWQEQMNAWYVEYNEQRRIR